MNLRYFNEIAKNTGKYCFGINETNYALESGAIEKIICYQDLDMYRIVLRNVSTNEEIIKYLSEEKKKDKSNYIQNGIELEVVNVELYIEWLTENYKNFGCRLFLVTSNSSEGAQFCSGFGGIGGILRYTIELETYEVDDITFEDYEDFL